MTMTTPTCSSCGCAWTANTKPGNCLRCDAYVERFAILSESMPVPEAVRLAVKQMARSVYP